MESVVKVQGVDVKVLREPYPARLVVMGVAPPDRRQTMSYGWWARAVAPVHGSFVYPLHGEEHRSLQQSKLHQALKRNNIEFETYSMGPAQLAVIVRSVKHKEEDAGKPAYDFFEPMVQRDPDDKQAMIRQLTDESALAFWSSPQARLRSRTDGDFPLHPRPEYLSLRRREYVDWLSTSDPGVTVLWPLVQDMSYVAGRDRRNHTVNAQATALHAAARKMGVRLQTRLFDDDFLALRIRASNTE